MGHREMLWGSYGDNQGSLWGFINTQTIGLMAFPHWVDPTLAMGQLWGTQGCYGAAMGQLWGQPGIAMGLSNTKQWD